MIFSFLLHFWQQCPCLAAPWTFILCFPLPFHLVIRPDSFLPFHKSLPVTGTARNSGMLSSELGNAELLWHSPELTQGQEPSLGMGTGEKSGIRIYPKESLGGAAPR